MLEAQDKASFSTCLQYIQNLTKVNNTYVINDMYDTSKNISHTNKDRMYALFNKNVTISTMSVVRLTNMRVLSV